jgi:hypothetical protein
VNVTDVLARVMQLQAQSAATAATTKPSGGADFATLLDSARATGPTGQATGLPSAFASMAGADVSPSALLTSLLPANLRAAATAAADPAQQVTPTNEDATPAVRKSCGCESH